MAVRIIENAPKTTPVPEDKVLAHSSIQNFKWVNDQTSNIGTTALPAMFDWVVNKKGKAYVNSNGVNIPVFGTISTTGQQYLRCLRNGSWSDELLDLPAIT